MPWNAEAIFSRFFWSGVTRTASITVASGSVVFLVFFVAIDETLSPNDVASKLDFDGGAV